MVKNIQFQLIYTANSISLSDFLWWWSEIHAGPIYSLQLNTIYNGLLEWKDNVNVMTYTWCFCFIFIIFDSGNSVYENLVA